MTGRYSLDYHYVRNFLHTNRSMGAQRAEEHIPKFAKMLVAEYNRTGQVQTDSAPLRTL